MTGVVSSLHFPPVRDWQTTWAAELVYLDTKGTERLLKMCRAGGIWWVENINGRL